jgi:hypothetical protein
VRLLSARCRYARRPPPITAQRAKRVLRAIVVCRERCRLPAHEWRLTRALVHSRFLTVTHGLFSDSSGGGARSATTRACAPAGETGALLSARTVSYEPSQAAVQVNVPVLTVVAG